MDWLILFLSGVIGGVLNSIAGGGSFITFPALLFAGVPPIAANATNTFASCAGYISGAYALRHEIQSGTKQLKLVVGLCVIGGGIGAFLLLHTPEALFTQSVPWLLLFAALLFTFGGTLNKWLKKVTAKHKHATSAGAFFSACITFDRVCLWWLF